MESPHHPFASTTAVAPYTEKKLIIDHSDIVRHTRQFAGSTQEVSLLSRTGKEKSSLHRLGTAPAEQRRVRYIVNLTDIHRHLIDDEEELSRDCDKYRDA